MSASGLMSSCETYGPMLSQMQLLCTACAAAVAEVWPPCIFRVNFLAVECVGSSLFLVCEPEQ
jgi:hypothetical protein